MLQLSSFSTLRLIYQTSPERIGWTYRRSRSPAPMEVDDHLFRLTLTTNMERAIDDNPFS
ncbi:MAG: hypothetical protein EB015_08055 [Methylocystaceae bacterium]|nr:hypothetical protein [Methylocystaceae bacterium]